MLIQEHLFLFTLSLKPALVSEVSCILGKLRARFCCKYVRKKVVACIGEDPNHNVSLQAYSWQKCCMTIILPNKVFSLTLSTQNYAQKQSFFLLPFTVRHIYRCLKKGDFLEDKGVIQGCHHLARFLSIVKLMICIIGIFQLKIQAKSLEQFPFEMH